MEVQVLGAENYSSSLLEQLHELQQNNLHCDARLTADGGGISAHKVVLMAASPYLSSCFSTKVQSELGVKGFVHIKDTPFELVERVITFIYTGKLLICNEDFDETYKLCKDLEIPEAIMLCETYQRNMDIYIEDNKEETSKSTVITISSEAEETRGKDKKPVTDQNAKYKPEKEKKSLNDMNTFEDKSTENCLMEKRKYLRKSLIDENRNSKRKIVKAKTKIQVKLKQSDPKKEKKSSNKGCKEKRHNQENENVENSNADHNVKVEDIYIDMGNAEGSDKMETEETNVFSGKNTETNLDTNQENGHSFKSKPEKHSITLDQREIQVRTKKTKIKQDNNKNIKVRRYKRFPCSFCSRILSTHKRLAFHEYIKHGAAFDEKRFTLYPCPKEGCAHISESSGNLKTHLKSRHGEDRPHVCEFCGKGFKLPNVLATHLNIHTGNKMWKCTTCGEQFNQQSGLTFTLSPCLGCPKDVGKLNRNKLASVKKKPGEMHVKRYHLGESSWGELCHLCSEKFLHKSDLFWHMYRAHNIPLPEGCKVHICEICQYQTKSIHDLERHQNAHKGIKQFSCSICKKMCSTKSQLKRHESFHGEKSFKCTYDNCSFACTDSIGLGKHIKLMHTHKHLKPYICLVCSYKTGVKGNLDKHIRQVHGLVVVAKHTVELKMKYANFESGDIITKEGQLIASAKQRKELYRQYIEENTCRMTINSNEDKVPVDRESTHIPENNIIFHDEDERKERKIFIPFKPLSIDFQQESSNNYAMNLSSVNSSHTELSAPLIHSSEMATEDVLYMQGSS